MSPDDEARGALLARAVFVSDRLRAAEQLEPGAARVASEEHPLAAMMAIATARPERIAPAVEALAAALPELVSRAGLDVARGEHYAAVLRMRWSGDRRMLVRSVWHATTNEVLRTGDAATMMERLGALDRSAAATILDAGRRDGALGSR